MDSITLMVMGGTGDLARKKLLPAIKGIAEKKPDRHINFVAVGRRLFNTDEYIKFSRLDELELPKNVRITYFQADFSKEGSLQGLGQFLKNIEENCIGRIFYLATSPSFFKDIAYQLSGCCNDEGAFNRIMIEKPFGSNLQSSMELDEALTEYFSEEQIYRVDHYLGKETVQNILVLRLSNPFIERTWNSDFIEKIIVSVEEDIGVGDRLGYYDEAGAIRDMVQNHLMQMAAFILMDSPQSTDAKDIHDAKTLAIEQLEFTSEIIIGQYEGYKKELEEAKREHSDTETFVELKLYSKSPRWKGTEILLRTGKNLKDKHAKIELIYRKEPCNIYCDINTYPNKLILNVQPIEDIEFLMNTKVPENMDIRHIKLNFSAEKEFHSNRPESYEILLEECIAGNKTLFISNTEIEAAWKVIDKVREYIEDIKPIIYKKGSKGDSTY